MFYKSQGRTAHGATRMDGAERGEDRAAAAVYGVCERLWGAFRDADIGALHEGMIGLLDAAGGAAQEEMEILEKCRVVELLVYAAFDVEQVPLVDKQIGLEILAKVIGGFRCCVEVITGREIIPMLVNAMNNTKYQQILGSVMVCLASVAGHCERCHDKVIFNLSYLNCMQVHSMPRRIDTDGRMRKVYKVSYEEEKNCEMEFVPFKKDIEAQKELQETENNKVSFEEEEEEIVEERKEKGLKLIGDEPDPGILPPEDNQKEEYVNDNLPSLVNIEAFLKYVDQNGEYKIFMPTFKLFNALIRKSLNQSIAKFITYETCFYISLSNEQNILEFLQILQKITILDKDIWEPIFAQSELYSKIFFACIQVQNERFTISLLNLISNIYSKKARIYNIPANDIHFIFCFCVDSLSASDDKQEIRLAASRAINSIISNNCNIREMLKCNLLQVTCNVFEDCYYQVKFIIVSYLSYIVLYGTRDDKSMLLKMNFVRMFVDILEYCDENLIYLSLKSLTQLLSFSTLINQKKLFCQQFDECVSDFFYSLPNHQNRGISSISSYFLDNYIDEDESDDEPLFSF